jgi:hypothetical protein
LSQPAELAADTRLSGADFGKRVPELALKYSLKQIDNLRMNCAVISQDVGGTNGRRRAPHVGDASSRLLDKKHTGSHIPWIQIEFPKRIDPAAGDVGEVDGGSAGAAHAMSFHRQLVKEMNVDVLVPPMAWKAGGDERFSEVRALGHLNSSVVQERATATFGREHFVTGWIVDHAGNNLIPLL